MQRCTRCSIRSTSRSWYLCHLLESLPSLPIGTNACRIGALLAAAAAAAAMLTRRSVSGLMWKTFGSLWSRGYTPQGHPNMPLKPLLPSMRRAVTSRHAVARHCAAHGARWSCNGAQRHVEALSCRVAGGCGEDCAVPVPDHRCSGQRGVRPQPAAGAWCLGPPSFVRTPTAVARYRSRHKPQPRRRLRGWSNACPQCQCLSCTAAETGWTRGMRTTS